MKTTTLALAALLAGLAATTGRADTRVHVGVDFGHPSYRPSAPAYYPSAPVIVAPAPHRGYGAPRGHWENVTTKVWIPERWNMGRDRWGRPVRILEGGHYAFTTSRVWVENRRDRHDRHDRSDRRDDRSNGYGYGRHDRRY